jgi:hypothetical protein
MSDAINSTFADQTVCQLKTMFLRKFGLLPGRIIIHSSGNETDLTDNEGASKMLHKIFILRKFQTSEVTSAI